MNRKISWDKEAALYLSRSIRHIRKESPQNADKIRQETIQRIGDLSRNPEIYPPDKYKLNNDGSYRYFELHRHRVS